jgi:integrase/recombinase XerD
MAGKKRPGRPAGTTGKARAITDKELAIVLAVTEKSRYPKRNIALLIMSNYLGLRAKELAKLTIGDVFDGNEIIKTLRLLAKYTKGYIHRDVTLENKKVQLALSAHIMERIEQDGKCFSLKAPLFRSQQGVAFSPNSISRLFIALYSEAGIASASSHSGRRSLITKLANSGIDLNMIRQIAGHKSIVTTQLYVDDDPVRQRNVLIDL